MAAIRHIGQSGARTRLCGIGKIAVTWDMNLLFLYVALFFILLFLLLLLIFALTRQLKDSISSKVVLQSRHLMSFRENKTPEPTQSISPTRV